MVIRWSRGGLSANEKDEILASNDKMCYAFGQEPITELAQFISVIDLLDFLLKRWIATFFRMKLL